MLTKPNHISQLLSPPFAKMVEPTDQSFSTVFFPYLRDFTWKTWNPHPNPVSSPPPITNPDSTTINTTYSHTKNPKECTETHNQIPHHWRRRRRRRRRRRTQSKKKKKTEAKKWSSDLKQWNDDVCYFSCYDGKRKVQADVVGEASNLKATCLTIPPGLSLTSFLESPVLLSNMKVGLALSLMPPKKSKRMHSKPKPQT